jgi:DNA (cytosine-5)-methyltransferase 1
MLRENEIIVDNFAGGGGASEGIEQALAILAPGRHVDIAINHDPEAVALHKANHPKTAHHCQSVWKADPRDVTRGRTVGLAWFSPDCKHFSKAKGGKPVEKKIRDLAWVVVHWAKLVRPRVIMLENVEEFRDWGPLIETEDGKLIPCPLRKGLTFKRWVRELRKLGYKVEYRELRACDYGAPTIRKRLFLIARCDGEPIIWPMPTHAKDGAGGLLPWHTAAECVDWSLPCPSIFLTKEEARAIGCKRPLVENTEARIAAGTIRHVLGSAAPFMISITHAGDGERSHSIWESTRTQTTAKRGEQRLVVPSFAGCGGRAAQSAPRAADAPSLALTAKADTLLVAGHMVQVGYGERDGQAPRVLNIREPNGTIVADGNKHRVVAAYMAQHNTGLIGHDARKPLSTLTQGKPGLLQQQVTTSHLVVLRNHADGRSMRVPTPTQTAGGLHLGEVRCFLVKYYGSGRSQHQAIDVPSHVQTTKPRMALVRTSLVEVETDLSDELRYAAWWCARFIEKYEGAPQSIVPAPRASAVGTGDLILVDIGTRMLIPRERFNAQGFRKSYIIDPIYEGKPLTETAQGRMCGNSVCPPMATALVMANFAVPALESEVA